MKRRSKHFGGMSEFTSIAGMFISDLIGATTIFGKGLSRGRACIKVCDMQFPTDLVGLQIITLKQQMVIGERSYLLGDRFLALSLPVYQNVST